jgi:hypothetical protein
MTATTPPRLRNAAGEPLGQPLCGGWVYTGTDLFAAVHPADSWGPWELDTAVYVLRMDEPFGYEVDLEECTTSARVLDRIVQVAHKTDADDATIAGLVRALGDILSPQANLCSFGASKRLAKTRTRELAVRARERREQALAVYGEAEP